MRRMRYQLAMSQRVQHLRMYVSANHPRNPMDSESFLFGFVDFAFEFSFLSFQTHLHNTKEKCRKFLSNLLELSSREPKPVEQNVQELIQELIDANVEPDQFCDRLERLLNASPQPCLIGFLKVWGARARMHITCHHLWC